MKLGVSQFRQISQLGRVVLKKEKQTFLLSLLPLNYIGTVIKLIRNISTLVGGTVKEQTQYAVHT